VLVLGKPLEPAQVASFVVIWAAIGLFVWDLLARRRSASQAPA
jgi:chloramphenicol-sensitive protein RarD